MASLSFIDVGEPTAERRRRNANQARSLVMTERRRRQRASHPLAKRSEACEGDDVTSLKKSLLRQAGSAPLLLETWDVDDPNDVSSAILMRMLSSEALTNASMLEKSFLALQGYAKPVTSHMHMLINHTIKIMWPKYWPARNPDEPSPLVKPWWQMFVRVPAVFHVFMYAAAVHYDDMMGQTQLSRTREILLHKDESLHQLRLAFKYGPTDPLAVCDQVLLAMTYLGFESEDHERGEEQDSFGPFKPPNLLCSTQWKRHYAYAKENIHTEAADNFILMKKGGLDSLTPPLAKSVSINDLQIAAKYIRKPKFAFWDIPDILHGCQDANVNVVPEVSSSDTLPCAFRPLLTLGLTKAALNVLERAKSISAKSEHYEAGTLRNAEYHLLLCEKNHVQHDLLSLPTAMDLALTGIAYDVYECSRIGALIYYTGVLFPLPHSTGAPSRLIDVAKSHVQNVGLEMCFSGGGRLLVWMMFLAGVMAQDTIERPFFLRRLKPILAMEEIKDWNELKCCCATFLWMNSACDEAGQRLYRDFSQPPYL